MARMEGGIRTRLLRDAVLELLFTADLVLLPAGDRVLALQGVTMYALSELTLPRPEDTLWASEVLEKDIFAYHFNSGEITF
jgi:hypothetical protein